MCEQEETATGGESSRRRKARTASELVGASMVVLGCSRRLLRSFIQDLSMGSNEDYLRLQEMGTVLELPNLMKS